MIRPVHPSAATVVRPAVQFGTLLVEHSSVTSPSHFKPVDTVKLTFWPDKKAAVYFDATPYVQSFLKNQHLAERPYVYVGQSNAVELQGQSGDLGLLGLHAEELVRLRTTDPRLTAAQTHLNELQIVYDEAESDLNIAKTLHQAKTGTLQIQTTHRVTQTVQGTGTQAIQKQDNPAAVGFFGRLFFPFKSPASQAPTQEEPEVAVAQKALAQAQQALNQQQEVVQAEQKRVDQAAYDFLRKILPTVQLIFDPMLRNCVQTAELVTQKETCILPSEETTVLEQVKAEAKRVFHTAKDTYTKVLTSVKDPQFFNIFLSSADSTYKQVYQQLTGIQNAEVPSVTVQFSCLG